MNDMQPRDLTVEEARAAILDGSAVQLGGLGAWQIAGGWWITEDTSLRRVVDPDVVTVLEAAQVRADLAYASA